MITGSADGTVAVWDTRNVKTKLFCLRGHTKDVNNVRFSKMHSNLLASSSHDRRIMIWDLSRFDKPQTPEEKEDGPPELLFVHGGHTDRPADISWNLNERLMMASTADDNVLQVWHMAEEIYAGDDDDDDDEEEDEEEEEEGDEPKKLKPTLLEEDDIE